MSIFGKLIRATVATAITPLAVVKDVVTAIPRAGDSDPFRDTAKCIKRVHDDVTDVWEELGSGD